MIKMILAIGHINYDKFLNNMLEMAKQHPEQMGGMKLPPFTAQMIKMLPARKKNEMVAQALNSSKGKWSLRLNSFWLRLQVRSS